MRARSIAAAFLVCTIFVIFEGWIFLKKFWHPKIIQAQDATIHTSVISVGTPVPGTILSVHIRDAQSVLEGQVLFRIRPQTPLEPSNAEPMSIVAAQNGVVTDITVVPGAFVQASERLARIIDLRDETLYVQAHFLLDPDDRVQLHPFLGATIRADFLNQGEPVDAVIASVSPVFDAEGGTVEAKIYLPSGVGAATAVGLPVNAEVALENRNEVKKRIQWVLRRFAPPSFGSPLP